MSISKNNSDSLIEDSKQQSKNDLEFQNANNNNIKGIKEVENNHNNNINNDDDDDDYNEEEDEDYVIDSTNGNQNGRNIMNNNDEDADEDDDDANDYMDEEDKKTIKNYSSIESNEGGLIKTRRQRLLEDEREKNEIKNKALKSSTSSNLDINSIWAELNSTNKPNVDSSILNDTSNKSDIENSNNEKIKITRTYEFAGKLTKEEKWVDRNSEEAKAHLNSTTIKDIKSQPNASTTPLKPQESSHSSSNTNLRRKRKRASLLDAVISNSSKTKLSTLEKSRLDWATYVDKNKISDELKYKNKGGFLEKQDFLNRVDSRRDNIYKEAKSKSSK